MTSTSAQHVATTNIRTDMIELYKFSDFLKLDLPEAPSLMGDGLIVPEGRVIIYGRPGTYKSFATLDLCHALAGAESWMGYEIEENIPTLYLQAEIIPRKMQDRGNDLADKYGDSENMHYAYIRDFTFDGEEAWNEIVDITNRSGAKFVFFDPLTNVMAGSELDDGAVKAFLKNLDRLTVATGAGMGFVHHARKDNKDKDGNIIKSGAGDLRGHSAIEGWADTIIRLRRTQAEKAPNTVAMEWEKVRHTEEPHEKWLRFDGKSGILRLSESDPVALVLQMLESGPKSRAVVDDMLINQAGVGDRRALNTRTALEEKGVIEHYKDPVDKRRVMIRIKKD